jgi:hypothetical protein
LILTLEGAPAVGKSTTAAALGYYIVPEVNKLFGKKAGKQSENTWYLQRQLERWRVARKAETASQTVVLDGDVFQPIWFSALFWQEDWVDIETTVEFFDRAMREGNVAMPSKFVVLSIPEETRAEREVARCLEAGRSTHAAAQKIARYSAFAEFQHTLFSMLNDKFPGLVCFLEASPPPQANAARLRALERSPQYEQCDVLQFMADWCRNYRYQATRGPQRAAQRKR